MKVLITRRLLLHAPVHAILCVFTILAHAQDLPRQFRTPPDTIQTSIYWYWLSDNISKEGVIKDLQAMKKAGINRAFIGNIGLDDMPYGNTRLLSEKWWDILHTTLKTATDLHIDIGMFNGPGWSQSGGPWIKPGQSMRYLRSTEQLITGPGDIHIKLNKPTGEFQDTRVIAFPAPGNNTKDLSATAPLLTSVPAIPDLHRIMDSIDTTGVLLPAGPTLALIIEGKETFIARSIVITPGRRNMLLQGEIQVKEGDQYRTIRTFRIDRTNDALNTGFLPYAPAALSIPATTGKTFRIVFQNPQEGNSITELAIRAVPAVENYAEKTLAKMYPTPLPYWKEYQWPVQPVVDDKTLLIDPNSILDLTANLSPDGTLHWTAPPGNWVIMRWGMTPTGVTNAPASPQGRGLEVDKMSATHVAAHFDAFCGEILRRIPAADRRSWKVVVEDSYETGGQNWTDDFIKKFTAAFGYDPVPYLPVFAGKVVGSEDISDRFLWDLRRFIADRVAYDYVGGLRDISHKNGLTTWLENYGHWGFPGEFLQYGGQSDEVGGEFWSEGELGNIENRAASSSAHIYGKTKVSAESFTAGGNGYARYPALLKQRGDRFFTEGINNTLLHVYIHQPDERQPGVNTWFGTEFNRHNTWFNQMDLFTSYLKRCNNTLQQGRYVADVAYFIGEDAPKMTGICDPALPKGYSFDYINAEVIEHRLTIKDGRWTLPDGLSYRLLILPKLTTMRPSLLRKLQELVQAGGILLGPPPQRSPSLSNYGKADEEIRQIAGQLWASPATSPAPGSSSPRLEDGVHPYGKGMVLDSMDMQQAFTILKMTPDCNTGANSPLLFIHRRTPDREIYFLSNQTNRQVSADAAFLVQGKQPQLWDPVTGSIRDLAEYRIQDATTTVPIKFEAYQSFFIVFNTTAPGNRQSTTIRKINFPQPEKTITIKGPWTVNFDTTMRGPARIIKFDSLTSWTDRPEEDIRNYSGTAIYHKTFTIGSQDLPHGSQHIFIDLGQVMVMAKVKVNGAYLGGVWTPPYRLDITRAVHRGTNTLEIEVVNNWVNRLIGDAKLPTEKRKTWTAHNVVKADSPYQSSGLLGPVKLETIAY